VEPAVAKLRDVLEAMPENEREFWDSRIRTSFSDVSLDKHGNGKPYTQEEKDKALASQAKSWHSLITEPQPSILVLRNGEEVKAPEGMLPKVTPSGQRGWVNPENGRLFSPPKDEGKKRNAWGQNRAGGEDTERVIPDMVSFRTKRLAEGKEWPARSLPPRTDISLNRDELIATISASQALWKNGLNRTDNEGKLLLDYYDKHPEELRRRVEDIADAYIRQGGRSGVTGNPIAIPGSMPKPGEEKSTIDHFSPISGGREYTAEQLTKTLDRSKNFLLSEEGPNSLRKTTPWSDWLDKVSVSGVGGSNKKTNSTPRVRVPKSTAARQPQTAEQKGVKMMLEQKIAQQAKEMGVSVATIKGDEDFLQMALGGSGVRQWKGLS